MRKIVIALSLLFITEFAHAGLINISTLSNDSQVSYLTLNAANNTIKNAINGNIESVNIKDGTITIDDMASSSSTGQREGDHFNAYTKTGMLPVTDASLTSDISAGTSYVKSDTGIMYRVVTSATSKTYTSSKDTWVYIDINGAFQYVVQALGLAQPTTPSNSLLLAKVVTNATSITSVVDHRILTISLGASDDKYKNGMNLIWVTTGKLSVDTGVVYVGATRVVKATQTSLNLLTAGDYISGAVEAVAGQPLYVYASPLEELKFSVNAPNYHNTNGVTLGQLYYYKYTTGGVSTYWRCLGYTMLDTITTMSEDTTVSLNLNDKIIQVVNYQTQTMKTGTTAIPGDTTIPQITDGSLFMTTRITPSSATSKLKIDVVFAGGDSADENFVVALFKNSDADALAIGTSYSGATRSSSTSFSYTMTAGTTSPIKFTVRAGGSGTITMCGGNAGTPYGATQVSSVTIKEYSK